MKWFPSHKQPGAFVEESLYLPIWFLEIAYLSLYLSIWFLEIAYLSSYLCLSLWILNDLLGNLW